MRKTNWTTTIPAFFLCLFGAFFSGHLLARHVGDKASGLLPFLCGPQDSSGCDRVLQSRWSMFPPAAAQVPEAEIVTDPGEEEEERQKNAEEEPEEEQREEQEAAPSTGFRVPVAMLGLCYFVILAVWWLFIGRTSWDRRRWHLLPTGITLMGCAMSAWFIAIMGTAIHAWCALCLVTHGINFVLIVFVLLAWPLKPAGSPASDEAPAPSHPTFRLVVTALALGLAGCAIVWQATTRQTLRAEKRAIAKALDSFLGDMEIIADVHYKKKPRSIPCRDDDFVVRAEPGERKQLVLFTDFQCGQCVLFTNELLKKHLPKFDGHLDVAIKHFPLCTECNEHAEKNLHPFACEAAYLAEAVRMQGGAKALLKAKDLISMGRLDPWTPGEIATIAGLAGLDAKRLEEDRRSESVRARVQEDIELGTSLDVPGTPTALLDGRIIDPIAARVDGFWEALAEYVEEP